MQRCVGLSYGYGGVWDACKGEEGYSGLGEAEEGGVGVSGWRGWMYCNTRVSYEEDNE